MEEIDAPLCACPENLSCAVRTVKKEGRNMGRHFFTCSKGQSDESNCNLFLWVDEYQRDPDFYRTESIRRAKGTKRKAPEKKSTSTSTKTPFTTAKDLSVFQKLSALESKYNDLLGRISALEGKSYPPEEEDAKLVG